MKYFAPSTRLLTSPRHTDGLFSPNRQIFSVSIQSTKSQVISRSLHSCKIVRTTNNATPLYRHVYSPSSKLCQSMPCELRTFDSPSVPSSPQWQQLLSLRLFRAFWTCRNFFQLRIASSWNRQFCNRCSCSVSCRRWHSGHRPDHLSSCSLSSSLLCSNIFSAVSSVLNWRLPGVALSPSSCGTVRHCLVAVGTVTKY